MAMSKRDCCASLPTSMVLPYSLLSIFFICLFTAFKGGFLFVFFYSLAPVAVGLLPIASLTNEVTYISFSFFSASFDMLMV